MRCKACDAKMTSSEMVMNPDTDEFEELCTTCKRASESDDAYDIEVEVGFIKERYKWDE